MPFVDVNLAIGNLPAGKTVSIIFNVTVIFRTWGPQTRSLTRARSRARISAPYKPTTRTLTWLPLTRPGTTIDQPDVTVAVCTGLGFGGRRRHSCLYVHPRRVDGCRTDGELQRRWDGHFQHRLHADGSGDVYSAHRYGKSYLPAALQLS